MSTITQVKGSFSTVTGSDTRIVYTTDGRILGTIKKLTDKKGYRATRLDGKVRCKPTLAEAFKTIRRGN